MDYREAVKAHERAQQREKRLRESLQELTDTGIAAVLLWISYFFIKRGIIKRGGPEWAAYGIARLAMAIYSQPTKEAATKLREQIEKDQGWVEPAHAARGRAQSRGQTMSDGFSFTFEGKPAATVFELTERISEIAKAGDKEKAARFLDEYTAVLAQHAKEEKVRNAPRAVAQSNVGYLSGYLDPETMGKALEVFDVSHPVFGQSVPTPTEAMAAGERDGAEAER